MRALKRFVRPDTSEKRSPTQVAEYYGATNEYYCAAYQKLQEGLKSSRSAFREAPTLDDKAKVAAAEFKLWQAFIDTRTKEMPKYYDFSNIVQHRLERTWRRATGRSTLLEGKGFLEFFDLYNKHYTGDFPFDQISILSLAHPIRGVLCRMPGTFHFERFMNILKLETLASYERSLGQQLVGKQLLCYNVWTCLDKCVLRREGKGYMDFALFRELLRVFFVDNVRTFKDLRTELDWTLKSLPREVEGMDETRAVLRFELAKQLFVERNAS